MSASAGAWIVGEGGQEISTSAYGQRDEQQFAETSIYWEVPHDDDASMVLTPWFESNNASEDGWRAEATVALKQVVWRDDAALMALQGGAFWSSEPARGCGEGGAELRWLGGRSFGDGDAFLNAEAATRVLEGGCWGQRIDLTAGYRLQENWLAMGQIYYDAPDTGEETVKAQFSITRFGDDGRGVQVGLRMNLDEGPQEVALVVGWWGRPGD